MILRLIPVALGVLILCAHFLRSGGSAQILACLCAFGLLFFKKRWFKTVAPFLLIAAALIWADTAYELVFIRRLMGAPWMKTAIILGAVSLFTAACALVFFSRKARLFFDGNPETGNASAAAFLITAMLLTIIQLKVDRPMLLLERFWHGGGWLEILALSTYSAWIVEKMADVKASAVWRKRIWLLFSVVFFTQLILGLFVSETFLMSGNMHIPVPAVILAGPIFRGDGFFMPVLFLSTLVIVGPAWCSHLCYMGAWDQLACNRKKRPGALPRWSTHLRVVVLVVVIGAAIALRFLGISVTAAAVAALGFGSLGVLVMILVSRKLGTMFHCVVFCPIGLIANVLGKISPFRILFSKDCDGCGACAPSCRFGALEKAHIERRKVGVSCTLCGDCVGKCKTNQLVYSFGKFNSPAIRLIFLAIVVSLHAVCLGIARI